MTRAWSWGAVIVGWAVVAASAPACSGSSANIGGASSSGGSSSSSSSGGGGGSSLNGTWDVVFTSGTRQDTATLSISSSDFVLDLSGFHLHIDLANAAPDITYMSSSGNGSITSTHTAAPLSLGALPLAVGGAWTFAGQTSERCNGEAHADSVSVTCTSVPLEPLRGSASTPGVSTAQRRAQLASIFGDLGGSWTVVTPSSTCDVTFKDNFFGATCSENGAQGTLDLTFSEGMASGKTSQGAELSAKRR